MAKQNKKAVRTATKSGGGKGPDAEAKLDGLAPLVDDAVETYLLELEVPKDGLVCRGA